MKNRAIIFSVALVLFFNLTLQGISQQPQGAISLRYKLEKGKTYRYVTDADIQSTQTIMGNDISVKSSGYAVTHHTVDDIDKDGNYIIIFAVDSAVASVKSPQRDTTMVNPSGIVGKRSKEVMSKTGKTISSVQVDSISGSMAVALRRSSSLGAFAEFGEKSVSVGETWSVQRKDSSEQAGGKNHISSTIAYTLVGSVDTLGYRCYKIAFKGTMAIDGTGRMMGMNVITEGTGTMNGLVLFAQKEGLVVGSQTTLQQELTAAVTGQQNMMVPISQTTNTKTRLLK